MRPILESLESVVTAVNSGDNRRTSVFGTRFVNDFFKVMTRIDGGDDYQRPSENWIFREVEFADQRRNDFVIRPKFLRKMSEFDKRLVSTIASDVLMNISGMMPSPYEDKEIKKVVDTVNFCRTIRSTVVRRD